MRLKGNSRKIYRAMAISDTEMGKTHWVSTRDLKKGAKKAPEAAFYSVGRA
jgi:hypothetical protein